MAMPEAAESPAIRKLGRLFMLTEVHLWEDSHVAVADESHKHRSSTETYFASSRTARIDSKPAKQTDDSSTFVEDLELANLMGSLGLPVSFSTSREKKNSVNKGKKNGTRAPCKLVNTPMNDAVKTEANAEPIDSVVQSIVCHEHTDLNGLSRAKVGYDEDSHDGVDKMLGEVSIYVEEEESGYGTICNAEITSGEAAENNCENEASQFWDKMAESVNSRSAAEENHVDDKVMQLNRETLGHGFVDIEYKRSHTEIFQEGSLSKREDQIFLETSSMSHDTNNVDCKPCQSSVQPYLFDKHDPKSDCSLYYEHGDWRVLWDTFYNRYYFYNNQTQESTWYPPSGLEDFALYCSTYKSKELDIQGSQDTTCPMQEHSKSPTNFDQSLDIVSSCEDNTTDCYTSEANQHVVQYVAHHMSTCDDGKETFDEATIIEHLDKQGQDPCDQLCNLSDIPYEDLTNESLVITHEEVKHAENVQKTSLMADVLDMDFVVASTKKKRRVRRSQSHHSCRDMAGNISNDIVKYWTQRYLLFSLFDSGIKMDEEGWFSVTPEPIAKHHASRVSTGTMIDCFTGVGGNAIQFATKCKHVIAVDIDPQKIECAQHNATVYGVNDQIDFLVGDFIQIAPRLKGETAFMSPPWGGPDYAKVDIYDIRAMLKPCDGYSLFKLATMIASRVVMFLPRNIDLNQLAEISLSVDPPWAVEVEKNFLNGKLKAITAYFEEQETNLKS